MTSVSSVEMAMANRWVVEHFTTHEGMVPFSFIYDNHPSSELLDAWTLQRDSRELDAQRTEHTLTWTEPKTGLCVRCEAIAYQDFPAVEWTVYLKNTGTADTPILRDIRALSLQVEMDRAKACRLHYAKGSSCRMDDFAPQVAGLGPNDEAPQGVWIGPSNSVCLESQDGRSSCGTLPFFNMEMDRQGLIGAIGWTGGWSARFWREESGEVCMQAGMKRTHLKLLPGEQIRTPRLLLLFWDGDRLHGQNMLRRFILTHHTPRPLGTFPQVPRSFCVWGENRTEQQIVKAQWLAENEIPFDNYWIDAGWHGNNEFKENSTVFNSLWWQQVGNWWPNPETYPEGLKPIGDAVRELGMNFTLWFEPERVYRNSHFTHEHPEWLLGPIGDDYLYNLGIPEACEAITEVISQNIREGGITCYRQDFNMDPAPFWQAADAPDRIGISEIHHIEGLYAFWDSLLTRHPGLLIDNCASGGRRIDLETISRSIPLWRSDYVCFPQFDPIGIQAQTQGLSLWAPLSTGWCCKQDTYAFRSALGPGITMGAEEEPWNTFSAEWLRQVVREQQELQPYFYGDFYPLLSYSLADDVWAVWQFDRPDLGEGIVIALRRPNSPFASITTRLYGLDEGSAYEIRIDDMAKSLSGNQLLIEGVTIDIPSKPGSQLLRYKRNQGR